MTPSGTKSPSSGGLGAAGQRSDPWGAFNFWVEVGSLVVGGFTEVSGLQSEIETMPLREGGLNSYQHQLPGPARYPQNLVFKRGLTSSDVLWNWYQDVANGKITRRNGTIYLLKANGETALAWDFEGAYPIRWTGPELRANGSDVAFESVELVHRGIKRSASSRPTSRRM